MVSYAKRSQTSTTDSDLKEEGQSRKSNTTVVGGRGITPSSPKLGNANNPNKAEIPDRKKNSAVTSVSILDANSKYNMYCTLDLHYCLKGVACPELKILIFYR